MRHIIPISGKDSLATALLQMAHEPDLPYEFMFNPTGQELPEVFEWLDKVEVYLGKPIHRVGKDLLTLIKDVNWFLPSRRNRYCTYKSKIHPMEVWIGKEPCTVYFGIRADEDRGGYNNSTSRNIIPAYPLKTLGITLPMVYQINHKAELKPPTFFWQRLWDEVCRKVGEDYIRKTFTEWEIDAIFAWRTRTNCAMCFNQRRYEWVGLLWHHPDLFWEYEGWEHNVSEYYLAGKDVPLKWIADHAEDIFKRRVNAVVKFIEGTKQQKFQFIDTPDDNGYIDILQITSCGLLCGK